MGIHDKSLEVLEMLFSTYGINSVLELGSQNFYQDYKCIKYGCYADEYYHYKGVCIYDCIDLNGENYARVLDLSKPNAYFGSFDLVTDFGTCEHIAKHDVSALYNCWKLKFDASHKLIVSANPAVGHWPDHGAFYFTQEFYTKLAELTDMKIVLLREHYAMHNYESGKEVCCVFEKTETSHWISLEQFKQAFQYVHPK